MQEMKFPILWIVFKQQVIVRVIGSVSVHYIKVLHILLVDSVVISFPSLLLAGYILPIARHEIYLDSNTSNPGVHKKVHEENN